MPKLKHVAIVSSNPPRIAEFYQQLFGMRGNPRSGRGGDDAASTADGYVWLAVNTRPPGRQAGLDHFGFEVEDLDLIQARLQDDYPAIRIARRPHRGFAAYSSHDPLGNIFDLSPIEMQDKGAHYANLAEDQRHARRISHLFLRTVEPEKLARFYQDILELRAQEKDPEDPNYYLTDGTVTLVVAPWQITDYDHSGIERPALDHIGFEVESIEAFKADLEELAERRPDLAPAPKKERGEGDARMKLLATCKYGTYHLPDPDGVLLCVSEHQ